MINELSCNVLFETLDIPDYQLLSQISEDIRFTRAARKILMPCVKPMIDFLRISFWNSKQVRQVPAWIYVGRIPTADRGFEFFPIVAPMPRFGLIFDLNRDG